MTHEEMIEQLENTILLIEQNGKDWWDERDIPILEESIKALQTQIKESQDNVNKDSATESMLNADLISRQVVKEQMIKYGFHAPDMTVTEFVEDLPSVQPEPFINKPCVSEQACHEDKMKVLEKIKAEIETEKNAGCHTQYAGGLDFALSVISKYMAESEEA